MKARTDDLLVERFESGEAVVYDRRTEVSHLLDPATFAVWEKAAGGASLEAITAAARPHLGQEPETMARVALDELTAAGLLETDVPASGFDRRSFLKRAGIAAVSIPVILTITASPAWAARSGTTGTSCSSGSQCASGFCPTSGGNRNTCQPCTANNQSNSDGNCTGGGGIGGTCNMSTGVCSGA